MSQMRVLFGELRAGFSAATVCALILGLLFANFAEAAAKGQPRVAKTGAYALCVQHLTHSSDKQAAPTPEDRRSRSHKCPGCCLAAALGSALVPERVTIATRLADPAVVIAWFAAAPREPRSLEFRAANGARAPPA